MKHIPGGLQNQKTPFIGKPVEGIGFLGGLGGSVDILNKSSLDRVPLLITEGIHENGDKLRLIMMLENKYFKNRIMEVLTFTALQCI